MTALPQRVKHETWTLAALSAASKTMTHLLISDSCILDRYLHLSHQNLLLFIYIITYGASMACTTSSPNVCFAAQSSGLPLKLLSLPFQPQFLGLVPKKYYGSFH